MKELDLNDIQQQPEINWIEEIVKCKVDENTEYIVNPCIEYHNGYEWGRFMTYGNISVIGGKFGSKKTTLLKIIMAAAQGDCEILATLKGMLRGRGIAYCDTEQSIGDIKSILKSVNKLSGMNTLIDYYSLEPYDATQRLSAIDYIISNTPNIGMLFIDGIRDLQKDINNSEESANTLNQIAKWKNQYNCHLCFILHTNKGQYKHDLRGHLGTELANKAELFILTEEMEDNTDVSYGKFEKLRGRKKPRRFTFGYSELDELFIDNSGKIDINF